MCGGNCASSSFLARNHSTAAWVKRAGGIPCSRAARLRRELALAFIRNLSLLRGIDFLPLSFFILIPFSPCSVTPAKEAVKKSAISQSARIGRKSWTPAFAGVTEKVRKINRIPLPRHASPRIKSEGKLQLASSSCGHKSAIAPIFSQPRKPGPALLDPIYEEKQLDLGLRQDDGLWEERSTST